MGDRPFFRQAAKFLGGAIEKGLLGFGQYRDG